MTRSELAREQRPLAGDRSLREQARSYGRAGALRKLRSIQATPAAFFGLVSNGLLFHPRVLLKSAFQA